MTSLAHRRCLPLIVAALSAASMPQGSHAAYSITEFHDAATGNIEQQLFLDGFQWGSLITTPAQAVALRFHPGDDPNGWGITWYPSPFLAGAEPRASEITALAVDGDRGVVMTIAGAVAAGGTGAYGQFNAVLALAYDAGLQEVRAMGALDIDLDSSLAAAGRDLNLGRIASNFLADVPLQGGSPGERGNTGDMHVVEVRRDSGTLHERWDPAQVPAHVPGDRSKALALDVLGTVNRVDTAALGAGFQIAVAEKPSFLLALAAPAPVLSAGFFFDVVEGRNFAADNVGVVPLVLFPGQNFTHLHVDLDARAVRPVPLPSSLLTLLSALLPLVLRRRRRRASQVAVTFW